MLTGRRCGGTARDVLAVEQDAALVRRLEAGEQAQQRGLAAAGRAEQREELALEDVERQAVDRGDAAEALADGLEPHQRPRGRIGPGRERPPRAAATCVPMSPAVSHCVR